MTTSALQVFGWLLWRDLRVLKQDFFNSLIDALIIPAIFIIIGGYILPYLGMPVNYGAFMICSSLVMMCYSATSWRGASQLVADIDGDRAILYELTLPLPSWLVFVKIACVYALDAMFLNILTLPMGKLLLWNSFSLSQFSWWKFLLIYPTLNLFFGFYSAWLASWVKGMRGFGRYWLRYGSQLMMFSGFQFPWITFYAALPFFAYVGLANPFVYAFEGARAAILGPEGSLPFWLCFGVLWVAIAIFSILAVRSFKRRLDFV